MELVMFYVKYNPLYKTELWIKLVLVSGSSLLGLLMVETGLRLLGWAGLVVFTPNPEWGYLMTPSQKVYAYGHPININGLGFRGPEVQAPQLRNSTRIVFIGDSVTYGGGRIREEQLFCRVVASLAQRVGINVEVVNLSAPGWSPQNWWRYIDRCGLHEAGIVVLVLPECDLARPFATMATAGHRARASPLRLGNIIFKTQEILKARHSMAKTNRVRLAQVAAANAVAVKRLRERVGPRPFLAVLIPSGFPAYGEFWPLFEAYLPQVLDLRVDLQDRTWFLDEVHLNARGHQLVGERIFLRLYNLLE
jgi:lysophospholipase L1-like esterase